MVTEGTEVISDLTGFQINGRTIPADIFVSTGKGSRPDLVILDRANRRIALMKLTITLQRNTENAHRRKKMHTQIYKFHFKKRVISVILLHSK